MKYEIASKIKWKHIILLLIMFVCMMTFMRYIAAQVKYISRETGVLVLQLGNSVENILQTMNALGDNGRRYYLTRFLIVDYFYAIVYAAFYFCSILLLLCKNGIRKKSVYNLCLFPIIGMLFDWLENIFLRFIILNWTSRPVVLCILFVVSNLIKFLFVYLSLLLVIIGILRYFICKAKKGLKIVSTNLSNEYVN